MEYTGFKDIFGKCIYEGDIVFSSRSNVNIKGIVKMNKDRWVIFDKNNNRHYRLDEKERYRSVVIDKTDCVFIDGI